MTGEPEPISPTALRALEQELADLRSERETVAATLRDTDSDAVGDQADQADELQRATELARLDTRISGISTRIGRAAVAGPPSADVVGVGSTVTVRFSDNSTESVNIGGVAEELDHTLVTADSPLGHALLGHRVGDTVTYETPGGQDSATVVALSAGD